jgi:hypothetical protein
MTGKRPRDLLREVCGVRGTGTRWVLACLLVAAAALTSASVAVTSDAVRSSGAGGIAAQLDHTIHAVLPASASPVAAARGTTQAHPLPLADIHLLLGISLGLMGALTLRATLRPPRASAPALARRRAPPRCLLPR